MTPEGRAWGFDVFDCPVDLFEYLANITLLCEESEDPAEMSLLQCVNIGHALIEWQCPPSLSFQKQQMAEIWRHGILLYLVQLLQVPEEVFNTRDSVNQIFQRERLLTPETSSKFSISWPLFQAGLCLGPEDEQRKQWLRDDFAEKFRTRGCCNPRSAIRVLERVWQTGDTRLVETESLLF